MYLHDVKQAGMPVTIITGFLGAGKSTLLNRILLNARGVSVAVFINELGALDIDGSLVSMRQQVNDTDLVLLNNGCICCTISENLVNSVNDVILQAQVNCIVVETTGAADLLPLLDTFKVSENFEGPVHVDSVITVVDALSFGHSDFLGSTAARNQVLHADVLLLNKVDLVESQGALDDIEMKLRQLSGTHSDVEDGQCALGHSVSDARIIRCSHANVDLALILDTALITAPQGASPGNRGSETAFAAVKRTAQKYHPPPRWPGLPPRVPSWTTMGCSSSLAGQHTGLAADGGFSSVVFECAERPFDPLRFVSCLPDR
eukprot:COSAG05_NODE_1806_length_4045_cov_2.386721_6_plen_318_part_00